MATCKICGKPVLSAPVLCESCQEELDRVAQQEIERLKKELVISETCRGCVYDADPKNDGKNCNNLAVCEYVREALKEKE